MTTAEDITAPRLMAPKEAAIATSLSRPLLSLMAAEGQFPQPVRLGERRIAFVRAEVEEGSTPASPRAQPTTMPRRGLRREPLSPWQANPSQNAGL